MNSSGRSQPGCPIRLGRPDEHPLCHAVSAQHDPSAVSAADSRPHPTRPQPHRGDALERWRGAGRCREAGRGRLRGRDSPPDDRPFGLELPAVPADSRAAASRVLLAAGAGRCHIPVPVLECRRHRPCRTPARNPVCPRSGFPLPRFTATADRLGRRRLHQSPVLRDAASRQKPQGTVDGSARPRKNPAL